MSVRRGVGSSLPRTPQARRPHSVQSITPFPDQTAPSERRRHQSEQQLLRTTTSTVHSTPAPTNTMLTTLNTVRESTRSSCVIHAPPPTCTPPTHGFVRAAPPRTAEWSEGGRRDETRRGEMETRRDETRRDETRRDDTHGWSRRRARGGRRNQKAARDHTKRPPNDHTHEEAVIVMKRAHTKPPTRHQSKGCAARARAQRPGRRDDADASASGAHARLRRRRLPRCRRRRRDGSGARRRRACRC